MGQFSVEKPVAPGSVLSGNQHALDTLALPARAISFRSSNAWEAHRASDFGMHVLWCNRYGQRRERLRGKPDFEIRTLAQLPTLLGAN
jgi:2-haloacid dehalogenase